MMFNIGRDARRGFLWAVLILSFGCATATGPSLTRSEVVLGEKQLSRAAYDYFFDRLTGVTSVSYRILQNVPKEKAKGDHPFLPFLCIDLDVNLHRLYGTSSSKGVMVAGVLEGFGARALDLTRGDEVVALDGVRIRSEKDIKRELKSKRGKTSAAVRSRRGSKEWTENVPLGSLRKVLPILLDGRKQDVGVVTDVDGFIYVTQATLDFVENDDELAFILARQFAPLLEGRVLYTMDFSGAKEKLKLSSIVQFYFFGFANQGWASLSGNSIRSFTEEEERKLDRAALGYLVSSGFDGRKAIQVFERLALEMPRKRFDFTSTLKAPSAERLILMRKAAEGVVSDGKVSKAEEKAVKQEITKKSLDLFLDKTLHVTGAGYRILRFVPKDEGQGVAVLPLLYLDVRGDYQKFYGIRPDGQVMIAGFLENLYKDPSGEIRRGDEILALNGVGISSEQGLHEMLQGLDGKEAVLRFRRGPRQWEQTLPLYRLARKFSFTVEKDDRNVNAFANPFGGITVTTAMLRFVDEEDQLALVMAHEIAHLLHKHVAKHMANQVIGTAAGVTLATLVDAYAPGFGNLAGNLTAGVVTSPYSQELEREADYYGLLYLKEAGYSPQRAYSIWSKFSSAIPSSRERSIISTHPTSPERFLRLRKMVEEMAGVPLEEVPAVHPDAAAGAVGPVFDSTADPESAGLVYSGLATSVKPGWTFINVKAEGEHSVFSDRVKKIFWFGQFGTTGMLKNEFARTFHIEWYAPDGRLYHREEFKAMFLNKAIAKTSLKLTEPLSDSLIGKWRVKVWKRDTLVDDRYFEIQRRAAV